MTTRSAARVWIALAAMAVVAAGCTIPLSDPLVSDNTFEVENGLGRDVELEAIDIDPDTAFGFMGNGLDEQAPWLVPAGELRPFGMDSGSCGARGLRALDPSTGEVLATYDQPLCGGNIWRIRPDDQ